METKVRKWKAKKMFVSHKFTVGAEQKSNLGFNRSLLDLFVHILLSKITWTWTVFASQNAWVLSHMHLCGHVSMRSTQKSINSIIFFGIFSRQFKWIERWSQYTWMAYKVEILSTLWEIQKGLRGECNRLCVCPSLCVFLCQKSDANLHFQTKKRLLMWASYFGCVFFPFWCTQLGVH